MHFPISRRLETWNRLLFTPLDGYQNTQKSEADLFSAWMMMLIGRVVDLKPTESNWEGWYDFLFWRSSPLVSPRCRQASPPRLRRKLFRSLWDMNSCSHGKFSFCPLPTRTHINFLRDFFIWLQCLKLDVFFRFFTSLTILAPQSSGYFEDLKKINLVIQVFPPFH